MIEQVEGLKNDIAIKIKELEEERQSKLKLKSEYEAKLKELSKEAECATKLRAQCAKLNEEKDLLENNYQLIEREVKQLNNTLSSHLPLKKHEEAMSGLKSEIEKKDNHISKQEALLKTLEAEIERLKSVPQDKQKSTSDSHSMAKRIRELEEQLRLEKSNEKPKGVEEAYKRAETFELKLKDAEKHNKSLIEECKKLKNQNGEPQRQMEKMKKDLEKLREENKELNRNLELRSVEVESMKGMLQITKEKSNIEEQLVDAEANKGLARKKLDSIKSEHQRELDGVKRSYDEQIARLTNELNAVKAEKERTQKGLEEQRSREINLETQLESLRLSSSGPQSSLGREDASEISNMFAELRTVEQKYYEGAEALEQALCNNVDIAQEIYHNSQRFVTQLFESTRHWTSERDKKIEAILKKAGFSHLGNEATIKAIQSTPSERPHTVPEKFSDNVDPASVQMLLETIIAKTPMNLDLIQKMDQQENIGDHPNQPIMENHNATIPEYINRAPGAATVSQNIYNGSYRHERDIVVDDILDTRFE